jgi:hypothetical protein
MCTLSPLVVLADDYGDREAPVKEAAEGREWDATSYTL